MMKSKKKFENARECELFVKECELDFETRLENAVLKACEDKNIRLITLSGPTCAGKTTTAKKLTQHLTSLGKKVHIVSIDDFFYDKDVLEAMADMDPNVEIDYDSEDTIDIEALAACVDQVFDDNGPTRIPKFDFLSGKRVGYTEIDPDGNEFFVFEGIQAVYPKVTALFHKFDYKSIYINVESAIDVDGTVFEPNEIRLMRRLVRDYNFRGAAPEFTFYLWDSVRNNEELNIFPNALECDFYINSTLPFEINLLKPYLVDVLNNMPQSDVHIEKARQLLKKVEGIEPIPKSFISDNSLYYEFLKR